MPESNSHNSLVSVLIGTFNRADLLYRAVNSVLRQSYDNLEVIIVDDASIDNTDEIARSFNDSRVKYVKQTENKGIAVVSNIAFAHCGGEYIALLGDDDEWTNPDKLKKQVEIFKCDHNNRIGIVGTWWQDTHHDRIVKKHAIRPPKDWTEWILQGNNIICGSMVLLRRSAWEAAGGFDERMKRGTDSELFRSIIIKGYSVKILPEIMGNVYVSGPNRMTPSGSVEQIALCINAIEYLLEKYQDDFDRYPWSKAKRYYQLAHYSISMYNKSKSEDDFQNSSSYLKKAIQCKVLFKPIIRWYLNRVRKLM